MPTVFVKCSLVKKARTATQGDMSMEWLGTPVRSSIEPTTTSP
jgi:hypothetical protein